MGTLQPKRLLAIGDIHGCDDLLQLLLKKVEPTSDDRLIFLGDYIDRGPDSCSVINRLLALQDKYPATVFLRGNHEQMLLDFVSGVDQLMFLLNGGNATLESYEKDAAGKPVIPPEHLTFFNDLKSHYIHGDFIFVHAGLRPGVPIDRQEEYDMLWIRGEFINSDFDWGKTVVFGHSPQAEVLRRNNMIGLDTGAVYSNCLTCCDLLTGELWQAAPTEL
jgi:serine/threonine protein phosphatase 1